MDLQGPHVAGNKEEFLTEAGREDWRGSDSSRCVNADFSQLKSEDVDKKLDVKLDSSDCRDGRAESPGHCCFEPPELPLLSSRDGERDGGLSGQSDPQPWGLSAPVKEETAAFDSGQAAKNPLSCFFCGTEFATGGLLTRHVLIHTGESLLRCIICKRTFALEAELVSHVCARESSRRHQSGTEAEAGAGRLFPCSQCGEEFSRREELNVHLRSHARGDPLKCSVCQAVCSDRDSLILHMRIHTRQTQFSCSVCGKDFAWRRHLTKHMEVHMKRKKVFRCRVCGGEFCTYYVLSKHKLIHQPPELHQGQTEENGEENDNVEAAAAEEDCGGPGGVTNPDPGRHLQPETDAEASVDFKAEDQEFLKDPGASGSELTPEQPSEAPESDIKTDIQQLAVKEDLTEEVKQEEPEPPQVKEEPEETEVTTFTFGSVPVKTEEDEKKPQPWQLYDSQAEDNGGSAEQPEPAKNADSAGPGALSCKSDDSADSDFWKEARGPQSGLNSESDSGKNPPSGPEDKPPGSLQPESDDSVDSDFWKDYKKPQASSNPLKQDAAETGVKYVNDLKPYSCTLCSKAFRYSSYLKTHMRQHTERYFCSVCGYRSTSSSNLKVHMRTHTGEKPFSCPVCDKKYTNKASMQSHMSVHAAERKYSCEVCKKSFAWYTELKYHQCPGEASHHETYEEDANINLKRNVSYS
ncbi:unnamed protein product [Menidia menidia]|uniref:(Atlantic silverside) hypothetical protein n=1 Tax=Menidia menidia TaxID=238744 RepID=A0A8S4ATS0_9TELE|nr:unnamed protein product [Menidia menidia]